MADPYDNNAHALGLLIERDEFGDVVVSEGVFYMHGTGATLPDALCDLADSFAKLGEVVGDDPHTIANRALQHKLFDWMILEEAANG